MMTENKNRNIARAYLEKTFGKYAFKVTRSGVVPDYTRPFELWRTDDANVFEVIHAPYLSGLHHRYIAVSDNENELDKSVEKYFNKDSIAAGGVEYEKFDKYFIAYD